MQLKPSIRQHLTIGAILFTWLFLFAFFARPFEHGHMDLQKWVAVSVGFSVLAFFAYIFVTWLQELMLRKTSNWTVFHEVGLYLLFHALYTISTYLYYRGPVVSGFYDFETFFTKISLNIIIILTPLMMVLRYYSQQRVQREKGEEAIIIKGDNKLDYLKINPSDLVCVSNTQNYVEIFFLEEGHLKTKLIRSTLKRIQEDLDFVIQIHRSHLINPKHFKSWKDTSTIVLTQKELPVSKTYRENLLNL